MAIIIRASMNILRFTRRKVWDPFLTLVKQGVTPHQLALTIALGAGFGMIPFLGLTTLLCTFWSLRLRLNVAFTILIGYLMQPFQIALYVPFVEMGQNLFPVTHITFTLEMLTRMFKANWIEALEQLWFANMLGIVAWLICFVPFGIATYFLSRTILSRVLPVPSTH